MAYTEYIYRFRNAKNGKSYIGKTNNPKMRINSHRTHTPKVGCRFGKAIIKYGLDYFEFSILHTVICQTIEDLNNKLNSFGVDARHIGSCCRGNRKTAGGFVWKYKEGGEYAS